MKKPARKPSGGKSKGHTRPEAQAAGKPRHAAFPIVGVGASAGGLEAFTDLLKHLPADTGMGFVLGAGRDACGIGAEPGVMRALCEVS